MTSRIAWERRRSRKIRGQQQQGRGKENTGREKLRATTEGEDGGGKTEWGRRRGTTEGGGGRKKTNVGLTDRKRLPANVRRYKPR